QLLRSSPLLQTLDDEREARLRRYAAQFLVDKQFHAAGGHALTDAQCLVIAAMACLPALNLGYRALSGWHDVIVYPGEFRSRRESRDDVTGVITEADEDMIGEAWDVGPIVLSWADVAEDLDHPFDGFNVVIHEIAHKLDMLDGAMNGTPSLTQSISRSYW